MQESSARGRGEPDTEDLPAITGLVTEFNSVGFLGSRISLKSVIFYKHSIKKRASRASALRAEGDQLRDDY